MQDFLAKQFDDKFLWVPFLVAFGAGLYFIMPTEPDIKFMPVAFVASVIILLFAKLNLLFRAFMCFVCGFLYATVYTHIIVDTPVLKYAIRDKNITATIIDTDASDDKTRLMLRVPASDLGLPRDANVRVTISDDADIPRVGDVISGHAFLFPPAKIEAPETFDYARWAYFNNLTANGFIDNFTVISYDDAANINRLRDTIHNRADSFLTDGLVLGYKNSVPILHKQVWTTAGVGHIWSISGFHMTLIGGWLFAIFYFLFRGFGFLTRRIPARYTATICAWALLFLYVCVSGFGVATWRAFLMTSVLFLALLLGRNAVSMRNISIAFLILFFVNPHFVTQPGFQLSFSAIFGLIWFFNDKNFTAKTRIAKIKNGIYAATMTAIVATIFTMPFIATHFNSVPLYGLVGNLILLPIFSIVIMPLVLLGTICAIFHGHLLLNMAMDVYNFAFLIANKIVDLPASNIMLPHIPTIAFICFILGLVFLILIKNVSDSKFWFYRHTNYFLCAICVLVGITIVATRETPIFYATDDHELIGMVYDSKLEFNKARASNHYFAFNTFRKLNNEAAQDTNIRRKCPGGVCIYESEKWTLAYIQKFVPLHKNIVKLCRDENIDFIVSYFDISAPKCNHKILHNGFVIYKSGKVEHTPTNRWWNMTHE